MVRTQIQLTDAQARRLRNLTQREGISLAEAVRRCIDAALGEGEEDLKAAYTRASQAVGAFTDPTGAAVAEEHDRYLDEALK